MSRCGVSLNLNSQRTFPDMLKNLSIQFCQMLPQEMSSLTESIGLQNHPIWQLRYQEMYWWGWTSFTSRKSSLQELEPNHSSPHHMRIYNFFTDLFKYTLQFRWQLNLITKGLNNHTIQYKWWYPATLHVKRNGASHVINSLKNGNQLLHIRGIILDPPVDTNPPLPQLRSSTSHHNQGRQHT